MKKLSRFNEMGAYPNKFTICTVISRIIDGLGFRYYWVTEGLREEDINYDPSNGGRTLHQTLNHIYKMVDFIGCTMEGKISKFPETAYGFSFPELRQKTLDRIEEIKLLCIDKADHTFIGNKIKVEFDGSLIEHSLWHLFNGPLPDTFYHLGQVVSFRRTLGNPIDPHVEPFFGKRMNPLES